MAASTSAWRPGPRHGDRRRTERRGLIRPLIRRRGDAGQHDGRAGTGRGTRTLTTRRSADFKSAASANSAIPAGPSTIRAARWRRNLTPWPPLHCRAMERGNRKGDRSGGPAAQPRNLPSGPPSPSLQMERGLGGEVIRPQPEGYVVQRTSSCRAATAAVGAISAHMPSGQGTIRLRRAAGSGDRPPQRRSPRSTEPSRST